MFSVKQLSQLAGVTSRTLRYYDQIDLLKPTRIGANGYRYYGEDALLRLQQILFYRELEMPLEDIQKIMRRRSFDALEALAEHREALQQRLRRLDRLIQTVDHTILYLRGKSDMNANEFFKGFTEEEEKKYTEEAMQMYDPETVQTSSRKWKSYSAAEKQRIAAEGAAVYADLLAAMPKGAASPEVQSIIGRWHRHIQYFWLPNDEQLVGLADLYNADPRFRKNFDQASPELASFMREAVQVYVQNRKRGK